MTRGGIAWDDKFCARCSNETGKGWEEFRERMQSVMQKRDIEKVKADLTRHSKERDKAMKGGLIRPFLLLVAMPAVFRNQVASCLGWTIFTQKSFGDAHKEAWQILAGSKYSGIVARCTNTMGKFNPLSSTNWYDIMVKVTKLAFSTDITKHEKKIKEALRDSKNPFIPKVEEEVLVLIHEFILSQMTPEQREAARKKEVEERDNIAKISALITEKTGITAPGALNYGYKMTNQILGINSQLTQVVLYESSKLLLFLAPSLFGTGSTAFGGALAVVPAAIAAVSASVALIATPLFVIGILGLATTGLRMIFGSSEGRVIVPMMTILNQRLLLALEGIRLEDYY